MASSSLDLLGFGRGYLSLADRILPSFTTVTTIPRYASMLCAALRAVQLHYPHDAGIASATARQERLKLVKSFERSWAIACGLAAAEPQVGEGALRGLRGIRSVQRRLETLSGREKYIQTSSFNLLSNQVRYGGIGIYSTFLEECHLASMQSFTLRPLGEALAEAFPSPDSGTPVHDEDARLSLDKLREWGARAHVGGFTRQEGAALTVALRGGEEADHPDNVRWAMLRMLAKLSPESSRDEGELLRRLATELRRGSFQRLGFPGACLSQIAAALEILEPFEQFYQESIFLFERVRGAASDELEIRLVDLETTEPVRDVNNAIRKSAADLRRSVDTARQINPTTTADVEIVLRESGILSLADGVLKSADVGEILRLILQRHAHVQSGKFDQGLPKAAWTRMSEGGEKVHLTAQRYQLAESKRPAHWKAVVRHPYRTESAHAFIRACKLKSL